MAVTMPQHVSGSGMAVAEPSISVIRSAMPRRQCHPRVAPSAADPAPRDVAHQVTDIAL